MKKIIALIIFIVLIGLANAGLGLANFYLKSTNAAESLGGVELKISKGEGIDEIAKALYENKLIKSEAVFKFYSIVAGKANKFKPGNYQLSSKESLSSLVNDLTFGPGVIKATIIPGMTLKEVDDLLSGLKIVPKGSISGFDVVEVGGKYPYLKKAKNLEGFLLPDTYEFYYDSVPKEVVVKILDNFDDKVIHGLGLQEKSNSGNVEFIVLASILEKEVIHQKDAQIVAGILKKRIDDGMRLQVDASVIYAVCGGRFSGCPPLKKSDFDNLSAYNTYRHKGYPPGPISNPGLSSIEAALNPLSTKYWYYLNEPGEKTTIFSATFDEHVANKIKYIGR